MRRLFTQKLAALAAAAVVLAGGGIAAVSAVGAHSSPRGKHGARSGARRHALSLAAAAAYLGIGQASLEGELRAGKSLAQIAAATPGKSVAGLIEAIVAERRARLDKVLANLPKRVAAQVQRSGGPGATEAKRSQRAGRLAGRRRLLAAAASYLGLSPQALRQRLLAGETLAQIAAATPGKSQAGLVQALVSARRSMLAQAVAAGHLRRERAYAISARLARRVTVLINRRLIGH